MHSLFVFAIGVFAVLRTVASQSTTLFFTFTPASVTAGQAATFKYDAPDLSSPVTITLRKGDPSNLETIAVLSTTTTGGIYSWTPSTSLTPDTDYALMITQDSLTNYSPQFTLVSASSSTSSTSPSTSTASVSMTTSFSINAMGTTVTTTIPCSLSSAPYATGNGTAPMATGTGVVVANATVVTPVLSSVVASTSTGLATSAVGSVSTTGAGAVSTGAAVGRGAMVEQGMVAVLGLAGGLWVFV